MNRKQLPPTQSLTIIYSHEGVHPLFCPAAILETTLNYFKFKSLTMMVVEGE